MTTEAFETRAAAIAEILRTHQYDEGADGQYPGRCFCGTQMGDQDEHQAIAIVEAGWKPAAQPPTADPWRLADDLIQQWADRGVVTLGQIGQDAADAFGGEDDIVFRAARVAAEWALALSGARAGEATA